MNDELTTIDAKLDYIIETIQQPRVVLLDSKGLAKKLNRSYPVARQIIKKRIFPSPIQFVLNNRELINERLLDEWLEVPENLEKLRKL